MRWSGVGIDEWWRNEQFWVIGGISAHLFAVFQGLLKVLAGIDTSFTVTSKASDEEGDFAELYMFKWTTLLIPPTTILIINLVGVVAGISYAINSGYQSWGPLFGKLFFAFSLRVSWVGRTVHRPLLLFGPSSLHRSSPCCGFVSIHSPPVSQALIPKNVVSTARSEQDSRQRIASLLSILLCKLLVDDSI